MSTFNEYSLDCSNDDISNDILNEILKEVGIDMYDSINVPETELTNVPEIEQINVPVHVPETEQINVPVPVPGPEIKPYIDINDNITLYVGDCIQQMKLLNDKSIDLIITSPPYWGQRDYGNTKQWGNEKEVTTYIERMKEWCIECYRVLKDTGSLFLNIGDKYSKKGLNMIPERVAITFSDNKWCLRNTIIWHKPNHMPTSVKDRFCNSYEYVYFFVKDSGKYFNYNYFSDIDSLRIKIPEKNRTKTKTKKNTKNTKNKKLKIDWPLTLTIQEYNTIWKPKIETFNLEKIKNYKGKFSNQTINMGQSPGARQSKGISYSLQRKHKMPKQKSLVINQYILKAIKQTTKKAKDIDLHFGYKDTASHWLRIDPGRSIPKPQDWFSLKTFLNITDTTYDTIMTEQHYVLQNVKNNPKGKNPGDLWSINTEKCKESHYAVFPTELPRRIITGFCPPGGVILDPFAGSGTTGLVAKELNKKCILIDCNPEFETIIRKRCT